MGIDNSRKVLIHIGLHKTATSYLQQEVFPYLRQYELITRPYTQCNFAFNKLQLADDILYDKSEILKELENFGDKPLLISDESFSGLPYTCSYINRSTVARRLKDLFPEASIMLFIRGQKSLIKSFRNQFIKSHKYGFKDISEFLYYPEKNYSYQMYQQAIKKNRSYLYINSTDYFLHLDSFKYYELISFYKSLFNRVHVFLYEDLKYDKEHLLNQLEEIVGEPVRRNEQGAESRKVVNRSVSEKRLRMKMWQKKVNLMTKNQVARKVLTGISYFALGGINRKMNDLDAYLNEVGKKHYAENNSKLMQVFPEIGIQKYPEEYALSTERSDRKVEFEKVVSGTP